MKTPPEIGFKPPLGYIANFNGGYARGSTAEEALEGLVQHFLTIYERQVVEDGAIIYAYSNTATVKSVTRREFKWNSP